MLRMGAILCGCASFLLSAQPGHADAGCDNSSLNGVYPFTANGFTLGIYDTSNPPTLHYLNPPQPLSSVGQYTFDGQGKFTRVDFIMGNGKPVSPSGFRPGQFGTYTINEDCTGVISLNASGAIIELQVVVVDFGASAHAIVASESVPFFPNPPPGTTCTPTAPCDEGVNILVELKKDVHGRHY